MVEILALRLKRLMSDWEGWRRGREFPSRADFTPFDLQYILGNVSLLDVAYDPLRFRYRIHASNLAERMGKELTNKSVDDIPSPDHARYAWEHFAEVVRRRVPIVYRRDAGDAYFLNSQLPVDSEVLVLPLSSDGVTINMLISALVWDTQ